MHGLAKLGPWGYWSLPQQRTWGHFRALLVRGSNINTCKLQSEVLRACTDPTSWWGNVFDVKNGHFKNNFATMSVKQRRVWGVSQGLPVACPCPHESVPANLWTWTTGGLRIEIIQFSPPSATTCIDTVAKGGWGPLDWLYCCHISHTGAFNRLGIPNFFNHSVNKMSSSFLWDFRDGQIFKPYSR